MFAANFGMSIMDNGYGMLISMMDYKLKEQGNTLARIDSGSAARNGVVDVERSRTAYFFPSAPSIAQCVGWSWIGTSMPTSTFEMKENANYGRNCCINRGAHGGSLANAGAGRLLEREAPTSASGGSMSHLDIIGIG